MSPKPQQIVFHVLQVCGHTNVFMYYLSSFFIKALSLMSGGYVLLQEKIKLLCYHGGAADKSTRAHLIQYSFVCWCGYI